MLKLVRDENTVSHGTFQDTNGTSDDTSETRVQTDLIGRMLAGALTRYLSAVTPLEEIEGVARLFRKQLH